MKHVKISPGGYTVGIWNLTVWNPETFEIRKHLKSGLFQGRISNGPNIAEFQIVPTIWKPEKMADLV